MKKPTRTISGVAPLAVMLPPRPCPHGYCTFCPALKSPQSYTPESPVVLRAATVNFSAYKQVVQRIAVLEEMGHVTDKIELIIMGGTFLSYPLKFQYDFILQCYNALNGKISVNLEATKKFNENAKHRCVALCIETRPDVCSENDIIRMREFGCTRVEIGVQMPDDYLYKITKRGHTVKEVVDATYRLKKAGFKVGYHLMPGLPGSSPKKDIALFRKIFSDSRFKPDQIKIYPCQVLEGAELAQDLKNGKYIPYTEEQNKELLLKMLKIVPSYCRIMRIMREIPKKYLISGSDETDLRKKVEEAIREKGIKLKEIRFREIGFAKRKQENIDPTLKIKTIKYYASKGREFFIEAVNKDNLLFGLLRLRLEKDKKEPALIRELHVYGQSAAIGEKKNEKAQHKGLGKELLKIAEDIARKNKNQYIRIISGVGVRKYYENIGYKLDQDEYMSKIL
jgi:elongator complex protein 3